MEGDEERLAANAQAVATLFHGLRSMNKKRPTLNTDRAVDAIIIRMWLTGTIETLPERLHAQAEKMRREMEPVVPRLEWSRGVPWPGD